MSTIMIAFEGADQAGKTASLQRCKQYFADYAEFAEEASTLLGGPQHNESDATASLHYQKRVLETQFNLEDTAYRQAQALGKPMVICDRGIPGASAFHPLGMQGFLFDHSLERDAITHRYSHVFILDPGASAGVPCSRENNPARRERDPEDVMRQHHKIIEAYANHPNVIHIPYTETFEQKWHIIADSLVRLTARIAPIAHQRLQHLEPLRATP